MIDNANGRIPVPQTEVIAEAEAVRMYRRNRFNPLRLLTPEYLVRTLECFTAGELREFAILAEQIAERDDTIASVKAKREKSIAQRGWQVLAVDDSPEAAAHKAALEFCYNNLTATNAYDRNERGGFALLVRQMMAAVSFKYATHHLVWAPQAGGITCKFEFVPLYFFENRTGVLRFVSSGVATDGDKMEDGEWMVTVGDGLMVPCSILHVFKKLPLNDWLAYSDKFSMPGIFGRTAAAKDSDAGRAIKEAVESFGQEWNAVIYGDNGSVQDPITLIEAKGSANALPMPPLIERSDRKIATLYRGADLSTMSSKDGQGTGASLQQEESDLIERGDAQMLTDTLNQTIDRFVLRHQFGEGVVGKAYVQIVVPEREDQKFVLESMRALVDMGVPIAQSDARERFGFSEPDAGEPLLEKRQPRIQTAPDPKDPKEEKVPAENAKVRGEMAAFVGKCRVLLGAAYTRAMAPVVADLVAALRSSDADLPGKLREIRANAAVYLRRIGQSDDTVAAFEKIYGAAFCNGLLADPGVAPNAFDPGQPRDRNGRWSPPSGSWDELGLPSAEELPTVSDPRPKRISREEALAKLAEPYVITDPVGNDVVFGSRIVEHFTNHEHDLRPEFLPHLEATVGRPAEIWLQATEFGPRFNHIGVFTSTDGTKSFGVVSHRIGETTAEVVTGTPKTHQSINNWRSGKLIHRGYEK